MQSVYVCVDCSEMLVRAGFQSLQLVIADFLPHLPPPSLPTTLNVSTRYGLQTVDINISLTSIGLLVSVPIPAQRVRVSVPFHHFSFPVIQWNIADYLFQNQETIRTGLEGLRRNKNSSKTRQSSQTAFQERVQSSQLPVFDILWMDMFRYNYIVWSPSNLDEK